MKIQTVQGFITLLAETMQENDELLKTFNRVNDAVLLLEREEVSALLTANKDTKNYTRHKKHLFKTQCEICGARCKGKVGVGIHKRMAHGIKGKHAEYQRKWREKTGRARYLQQNPHIPEQLI